MPTPVMAIVAIVSAAMIVPVSIIMMFIPAPAGLSAVIPTSMIPLMPSVMVSVIAVPFCFTRLGLGSDRKNT